MKKAVLVQGGDWEGLFVDGKLIEEGHCINEGNERAVYFAELAHTYDFILRFMDLQHVTNDYDLKIQEFGSFPDTNLDDVELI